MSTAPLGLVCPLAETGLVLTFYPLRGTGGVVTESRPPFPPLFPSFFFPFSSRSPFLNQLSIVHYKLYSILDLELMVMLV